MLDHSGTWTLAGAQGGRTASMLTFAPAGDPAAVTLIARDLRSSFANET